jgi:hypothetical protein
MSGVESLPKAAERYCFFTVTAGEKVVRDTGFEPVTPTVSR